MELLHKVGHQIRLFYQRAVEKGCKSCKIFFLTKQFPVRTLTNTSPNFQTPKCTSSVTSYSATDSVPTSTSGYARRSRNRAKRWAHRANQCCWRPPPCLCWIQSTRNVSVLLWASGVGFKFVSFVNFKRLELSAKTAAFDPIGCSGWRLR